MLAFKHLAIAAAGTFALAAHLPVGAQAYPDKPIKVIIPWPPAGIVDIVGRVVGERVQADLGQTIIIDNKPGAGGMLGADLAARADADGYTLMLTSTALNMNTALGRKMSADVAKAFAPIRVVAWAPSFLVADPGLKLNTVKDIVALAKAKPGALTYASAGNGSPAHFAAEMFRSEAGIDIIHVPYKGAPTAMTDQIAGRVSFHFANATVALPQIKAGKITGLAITADTRSVHLPNVPTMAEAGYPNVKASQWLGYFAPAGTRADIVARLAGSITKAMAHPDVKSALEKQAMDVDTDSSPDRFAAMMKSDLARWQAVVKAANIKLD